MDATEISTLAHHLFDEQGPKAIIEAAQKATSFEGAGDKEQAEIWRRVEALLWEMRGPNAS